MEPQFFAQTFPVLTYECDPQKRLSLGSLLRRAQQVATDHCSAYGLGAEEYERTHTAFLLAKMAVEMHGQAREGDVVTLKTRSTAALRAVFHRYTTLTTQDGTLLAEIDARWVLVDTQTRRILRRVPEDFPLSFGGGDPTDLDVTVRKVEHPQQAAEATAVFSRCDGNHHLNNTAYADVIYDALPVEAALACPLKRFAITYHHEIPLGHSFAVMREEMVPGTFVVQGKDAETVLFEAEIVLEK